MSPGHRTPHSALESMRAGSGASVLSSTVLTLGVIPAIYVLLFMMKSAK
jgi:hypothetical protein